MSPASSCAFINVHWLMVSAFRTHQQVSVNEAAVFPTNLKQQDIDSEGLLDGYVVGKGSFFNMHQYEFAQGDPLMYRHDMSYQESAGCAHDFGNYDAFKVFKQMLKIHGVSACDMLTTGSDLLSLIYRLAVLKHHEMKKVNKAVEVGRGYTLKTQLEQKRWSAHIPWKNVQLNNESLTMVGQMAEQIAKRDNHSVKAIDIHGKEDNISERANTEDISQQAKAFLQKTGSHFCQTRIFGVRKDEARGTIQTEETRQVDMPSADCVGVWRFIESSHPDVARKLFQYWFRNVEFENLNSFVLRSLTANNEDELKVLLEEALAPAAIDAGLQRSDVARQTHAYAFVIVAVTVTLGLL